MPATYIVKTELVPIGIACGLGSVLRYEPEVWSKPTNAPVLVGTGIVYATIALSKVFKVSLCRHYSKRIRM